MSEGYAGRLCAPRAFHPCLRSARPKPTVSPSSWRGRGSAGPSRRCSAPSRQGPGSECQRGIGGEKVGPLAGGVAEGAREFSAGHGPRSQPALVTDAFGADRYPILFGHRVSGTLLGVGSHAAGGKTNARRLAASAGLVIVARLVEEAHTPTLDELLDRRASWRRQRTAQRLRGEGLGCPSGARCPIDVLR